LIHSRIIGTGSYLPAKIVTNYDLEKMVDTTHDWIFSRSGIVERHVAAEGEMSSDLAFQASSRAIEAAGISANDIDLIIVATTTPDHIFPSTACVLQDKLGIKSAISFDIQAVCSGFIYALNTADLYIRGGQARNVLVVGTEVLSRILNWEDRTTCVLFGDGAGAVVLQRSDKPGIMGAAPEWIAHCYLASRNSASPAPSTGAEPGRDRLEQGNPSTAAAPAPR